MCSCVHIMYLRTSHVQHIHSDTHRLFNTAPRLFVAKQTSPTLVFALHTRNHAAFHSFPHPHTLLVSIRMLHKIVHTQPWRTVECMRELHLYQSHIHVVHMYGSHQTSIPFERRDVCKGYAFIHTRVWCECQCFSKQAEKLACNE